MHAGQPDQAHHVALMITEFDLQVNASEYAGQQQEDEA